MKIFFLISTVLLFVGASLQAQIPRTLYYQADLRTASDPIADGIHSVAINLYSSPTGGSAFYRDTQQVAIVNHIVNLRIGTTSLLDSTHQFDSIYYIGLSIDATAEMPLEAFTSTAYSLHSSIASGLTSDAIIPSAVIKRASQLTGQAHSDLSGNFPQPKVIALQSVPISLQVPKQDQILVFDGNEWVPTDFKPVVFQLSSASIQLPSYYISIIPRDTVTIPRTGVYRIDVYTNMKNAVYYHDNDIASNFTIAVQVNNMILHPKKIYTRLNTNTFHEDTGIRIQYSTILSLSEGDSVIAVMKADLPIPGNMTASGNTFTCIKIDD